MSRETPPRPRSPTSSSVHPRRSRLLRARLSRASFARRPPYPPEDPKSPSRAPNPSHVADHSTPPPLASFDARTAVVDRLPAASAPTRPKPPQTAAAATFIVVVHPSTRPLVRRPRATRPRNPLTRALSPPTRVSTSSTRHHGLERARASRSRRRARSPPARVSTSRAPLSAHRSRRSRARARCTDRPSHRRRARSSSPPRARRRLAPRAPTARASR